MDRIRKLNAGLGLSRNVDEPASEAPEGQLLWKGWLGKAGTGVLSATWNKREQPQSEQSPRKKNAHTESVSAYRYAYSLAVCVPCAGYCVVHVAAQGPLLSQYEAADMQKLKGGRFSLAAATISHAEDKLQLTGVTPTEGTSPSKPVNARFKAASASEAAEVAERMKAAISGGSAAPSPPETSQPPKTPTAKAEEPAEKLQRQQSANKVEAARDAERDRQLAESKANADVEAAERKANQAKADLQMEAERERRVSEGPESPFFDFYSNRKMIR